MAGIDELEDQNILALQVELVPLGNYLDDLSKGIQAGDIKTINDSNVLDQIQGLNRNPIFQFHLGNIDAELPAISDADIKEFRRALDTIYNSMPADHPETVFNEFGLSSDIRSAGYKVEEKIYNLPEELRQSSPGVAGQQIPEYGQSPDNPFYSQEHTPDLCETTSPSGLEETCQDTDNGFGVSYERGEGWQIGTISVGGP